MNNYFKVIRSGICETDSKKCQDKIKKYFEACEFVGDYYYTQKRYYQAINYYKKVSEINLDGHGFWDLVSLDSKSQSIYGKIIKKLGDMSFDGVGQRKNIVDAFYYYNIMPSPFSFEQIGQFSLKIFGDSTRVFFDSARSNDSFKIFYINPFYITDFKTILFFNKFMNEMDNKLLTDGSLQCYFKISILNFSEIGQARSHIFIDGLLYGRDSKLTGKYITDFDFDHLLKFKRNEIEYYVLQVKLQH
ncbi:hypothetical protein [Ferruginibacter profundus]